MLITVIKDSLDQISNLLTQLPEQEYARPWDALSEASIGEHTRHVIEMFQCLENGYEQGIVNYDDRQLNHLIQTSTNFATEAIATIKSNLDKPNKAITLQNIIEGCQIFTESNYNRELLFNYDHCVHHQALIKVAIFQNKNISIDQHFGVARSTIKFRNQCVQ